MSTSTPAGTAPRRTAPERRSDLEWAITRTFDAPVHLVFEAWTTPDWFRQWWVPDSSGARLLSCEQDVRVGGRYRLEMSHPAVPQPLAFFGAYREVVPDARLVWTNEESEDGAITTVTFQPQDGRTLLVMSERYASKQALDTAIDGMFEAMPETFDQLDRFLAERGTGSTPA